MMKKLRKKRNIVFQNSHKNIKYLGITLTKEVKDVLDKNFNSLNKEIEEDTRRWKYILCTWIGRINIIKIAILLKAIYTFNAIPIKITTQFITDLERTIINIIWKKN